MPNGDKQAALALIQTINAVEGFDPSPLAVEYTDMNSGEKRLRLPVMAQIAWFRLRYPEGRISTTVSQGKDCFIATARVYHHFSDPADQFLAEASASRGYLADKPTVSPREWAQTASIGIALRNAGFGLQFGAAGDSFDTPVVDELGGILWSNEDLGQQLGQEATSFAPHPPAAVSATPSASPKPTETPLEQAMKVLCPIKKHSGKTLGDVMREDPKAIIWVATKFTGDPNISAAAQLICDHSVSATA